MWKPEHRRLARRTGLRYDSDMSDEEWAVVEPLIAPAKRGGRKRGVNVGEILNAIFYVLWTGCQWKAQKAVQRTVKRPDRSIARTVAKASSARLPQIFPSFFPTIGDLPML